MWTYVPRSLGCLFLELLELCEDPNYKPAGDRVMVHEADHGFAVLR
jgi:hypothetical protein